MHKVEARGGRDPLEWVEREKERLIGFKASRRLLGSEYSSNR